MFYRNVNVTRKGLTGIGLALGLLAGLLILFPLVAGGQAAPTRPAAALGYDLRLEKKDSSDPVAPGALLTYTLAYKVIGSGDVTVLDVTVGDTVPVNTAFKICEPAGVCTETNGMVIWKLGDLTPPSLSKPLTGTLTLVVTVTDSPGGALLITNTAWMTEAGGEFREAVETTLVGWRLFAPLVLRSSLPDLTAASKLAEPSVIGAGQELTYTIRLSNTGSVPAEHAILTDTLPALMALVGVPQGGCSANEAGTAIGWEVNVGAGEEKVCAFQVQVSEAATGTITNTARIFYGGPGSPLDLPVAVDVRSWQRAGLTGLTVYNLGACDENHSVVYAGTREGVYRSDTGGQSWPAAPGGLVDTRVNWVVVHPVTDPVTSTCKIVYAATSGMGVQASIDGGVAWEGINDGLPDPTIYSLALAPDGRLYAGTEGSGVYRGTKGELGWSWTAVNAGLPETALVDALVISSAATDTILYAGTWGQGVFWSTDGGDSWQPSTGLEADPYIYSLALDPSSPGILYAGTHENGVYRSEDGGQTWGPDGFPLRVVYTLAAGEAGPIYAGSDGTTDGLSIFRRSGVSWEPMRPQIGAEVKVWSLVANLPGWPVPLLAGTTDGVWWYGVAP